MKKIKLTCILCGGEMDFDPNQVCPSCWKKVSNSIIDITQVPSTANNSKKNGKSDTVKANKNNMTKRELVCTFCGTGTAISVGPFGQICSSCIEKRTTYFNGDLMEDPSTANNSNKNGKSDTVKANKNNMTKSQKIESQNRRGNDFLFTEPSCEEFSITKDLQRKITSLSKRVDYSERRMEDSINLASGGCNRLSRLNKTVKTIIIVQIITSLAVALLLLSSLK